ncbi:MAG: hypothetical protein P0S95_06815 [Rhabdochlamydiaceae bacterium]|nr:hypothetical protein [Candidatus Amphrikana amoebophyrae]
MERMRDSDSKDNNKELSSFVEKISTLFDKQSTSSAQIVLTQEKIGKKTRCHLSGYQLRRSPLKALIKCSPEQKKRVYMKVIPKELYREIFNKKLFSQVLETHNLTLKQDLHFDAFKQLLYEKGLVVKQVIDWKMQRSESGLAKIKAYGKRVSAVEPNPSIVKKVCIITRDKKK